MYYEIRKLRRFKTMVDNGKEVRRAVGAIPKESVIDLLK